MDDKSAGLALILAIGGTLISLAIGYAVFTVAKPSNGYLDNWEKSPHNYGRLWLAYTLGLLFFALTSLAIFQPAGLTTISVLIITPIFTIPAGIVSYLLGYLYGKSKQKINQSVKVSQFVKETNETLETASKMTTKQSIKKSVKSLQGQTTENNLPKNKTMDDENTEEINDKEYYLIATQEFEGSDRDDALWAKSMATEMGDETKAKYSYINSRAAILKQEERDNAKQRKILEEKIRKEVYVSMERTKFLPSISEVPENDLSTNNLYPRAPNDFYRKSLIERFEQKVKERLEEEFNSKSN